MAVNTGVIGGYNYHHIADDSTSVLSTTAGILHLLTFNNPTATEVVTVYDGVDTSGAVIAAITVPASPLPVTLIYDVSFTKGLTVVTATATGDITVSYI